MIRKNQKALDFGSRTQCMWSPYAFQFPWCRTSCEKAFSHTPIVLDCILGLESLLDSIFSFIMLTSANYGSELWIVLSILRPISARTDSSVYELWNTLKYLLWGLEAFNWSGCWSELSTPDLLFSYPVFGNFLMVLLPAFMIPDEVDQVVVFRQHYR